MRREAGSTAVQEIAFTLANAIAYVQAAIDAGLDVDDCNSTLLRLADMAMYVAKKNGRNRTAVAAEPVRRRTSTTRPD